MLCPKCEEVLDVELFPFFYELKPIAFHPYTSSVQKRILNVRDNMDYYRKVKAELLKVFNDNGIKCHNDNKIVFECEWFGQKICIGFYDWTLCIGFDYYDENEK